MSGKTSAEEYLPKRVTLSTLRRAADSCKGCELYERATQTVFGAGAETATVMFVGEMPGDREDREGAPFVGPAGRLLSEAIHAAGLESKVIYVTNAVKHFQWEERGKRRLHKNPRWRHVEACKPWLRAEIGVVAPRLIVCLGATAAQALLGADFRITQERGKVARPEGLPPVLATYHPAAILRAPKKEETERMRGEFEEDLRKAVRILQKA